MLKSLIAVLPLTACELFPPVADDGCGGSLTTSETDIPAEPECEADPDCEVFPYSTMHPECATAKCKDGRCAIEVFSPPYACSSPEPDASGVWQNKDSSTGQCYGGQCCFGCIVDFGSHPREIDISDGPCVAGNSDDFCGAAGQLCINCTLAGGTCVDGACAYP
jgi:hypothetical protein